MTDTNHRTQAPYDILTARDALTEAANLNRQALGLLNLDVESNSTYAALSENVASIATVANSLATYALALRVVP